MNNKQTTTTRKVLSIKKILASILAFIIIFQAITYTYYARANTNNTTNPGTQVNVRLDLQEEVAIVTAGPGSSTKFYISMDNMKSWESIDNSSIVDLSSILTSKSISIYFKGNKDTNPVKVDLSAEDKALKVKYEVVNGEGRIVISGTSSSVEYRKGNNGSWKAATPNMPTAMYELKGATLYFRTVASPGKRAGKIVTLKVPKRPAAPSVNLDADKLQIKGLKSGQTQYRIGDAVNWTTFTSADKKGNTLDLFELLKGNTPSTNNVIPAGIIEFRTLGSDKKIHSAVKIIEIQAQAAAPSNNVVLTGTTLFVSDSDEKKNYEYTVVAKNATLDMTKAKWTVVAPSKPVIVRNANVGDKILVRVKSSKSPETKQILLPSAYKELIVTEVTPAK